MTDTVEPKRITAGDSVTWTRSLSDYPASSGWVLSYALINAAGKISITATASGADHLISVSATTSVGWAAGRGPTSSAAVPSGSSSRRTRPGSGVSPTPQAASRTRAE